MSTVGFSQPFPQAHAHNDYEHRHPLFDALQSGFTSVEADIFLVKGKLLVAHTYPIFGAKSLEELYLAPLDSIVRLNDGRVYPGYNGPFFLMIDLKSDGQAAYPVLKDLLWHYPSLLWHASNSPIPVTIFLSGERPLDAVMSDRASPVTLDGRPGDLGKGYSAAIMPVVSDTFKKWSGWNGTGNPSAEEIQKIRELASRVHSEGKKLRLWAIPDNPNGWKALLDAGVDLINSDHLSELSQFLKTFKG
jgi:hypothetical protein